MQTGGRDSDYQGRKKQAPKNTLNQKALKMREWKKERRKMSATF